MGITLSIFSCLLKYYAEMLDRYSILCNNEYEKEGVCYADVH